ncbi:MAG: cell division protein FtsZ [Candidatus Delongbacteria bacterium]|nr:cell division protein FtsZ [Candidatus Delongbacteria bacterium]
MNFDLDYADSTQQARLKVVGIGGAGGNAINRMIESGLQGVDFIAVNTDSQALERSLAPIKLQIGSKLTRGLGAGASPEVGYNAAEESREEIKNLLADTDMLFITAGMGGGTGTGAASVIAEIAKENHILTVGIVTRPFVFEGKVRTRNAEFGIEKLKEHADTIIVIPNQKLLSIVPRDMPYCEAFRKADEILFYATEGISSIITETGYINVDFSDVKTVMREKGGAIMGTGISSGDKRASDAAQQAISSPLLDDISISGAKGVLINITGGLTTTLKEIEEAANIITNASGDEANVILGTCMNEEIGDKLRVTVIATGFQEKKSAVEKKNSLNPGIQESLPLFNPGSESSTKNQSKGFTGKRITPDQYFSRYKTGTDLEIPAFLRRQMD